MARRNATRMTIRLLSTESSSVYWTTKSKRNTPGRLELRKYDPKLRRHVTFKEAR
ncbi:MAG TPA: 50S ribosomal protein L33 [Solirubrobacteraceae bacterium]|nr:50S ribosomal protein L33 [Solirubrobacteraceae bacterium]